MKFQTEEGRVFVTVAPESDGMPAQISIDVFGSPASAAALVELIQRGAQTWADAPALIKGLADLVTNGEVLQDYKDDPKKEPVLQVIDMSVPVEFVDEMGNSFPNIQPTDGNQP